MILITGGCGFIGYHLTNYLSHHSSKKIYILDDLSNSISRPIPENVTLIQGDIRDANLVQQLMKTVKICYHLAAITDVSQSENDPMKCLDVNLMGSINIFQAAVSSPTKPLVVYASSSAVYGHHPQNHPITELDKTDPINFYGQSKLQTENWARYYGKHHNLKSFGLRFFNVYGFPYNPHSKYGGVIRAFFESLVEKRDLKIYGDGQNTRDFINVADIVAIMTSLSHKATTSAPVVNLCSGHGISILDLACLMQSFFTTTTSKIVYEPAMPHDIDYSLGDPSALLKLLPDYDFTSLQDGLKEMSLQIQKDCFF